MAENVWADFGSASIKKETDAVDDDWADFGGFESASPAINGSLQGGSLIPWAAYGSPLPAHDTSVDQQKATHTPSSSAQFPFFPSTSITTTTTEVSASSSLAATSSSSHSSSFVLQDEELPSSTVPEAPTLKEPPTDTVSGSNDRTEYDSFHSDFASFLQESLTGLSLEVSSSLKEPNLIKSSSSSGDSKRMNLSDVSCSEGNISAGADSTTATVEEKTIVKQQPLENTPDHLDDLDNEVSSAQDILSVVMAQQQQGILFDQETDNNHKELTQQLQVAEESKKRLKGNLEGLKEELSIAEKEKLQLCQELETLLGKNKQLEEESRNLNESLEKQIIKHRKLQELHEEQIQEIRKAGYDALAVIVEEYKELSRKAVLEQQAENKLQMETVLEEQRKGFEQFLRNQEEQFQSILLEEKEKNENKSNSLLEDEKQKHQSEIELCLEQERLKSKQALDKAVEDTRQHGLQALHEAVTAEKQKYDEFVTQQKEAVGFIVHQEVERLQKIIVETLKEERESSKVALQEALKEERADGKKLAQQVVNETKCEMLEYFKGKQEADKVARQKHLHSLDLFLESARTQVKTLIGEQVNKDPGEA